MRDYSKLFKRVQAWVLTVAMILPVLSSGLLLPVSAADEVPNSLTEGQIVAENYELTDAEELLLSSGLLVGETHNVYVPDEEDGLVSVDEDTKTITAKSYEKDGYTWNPVSADIVVENQSKEKVAITDGKGTYAYSGNAFSVKVLYRVEITVAEGTQTALLNAPGVYVQGVKNLKAIAEGESTLELLARAEVMDILSAMAGSGYYANFMGFTIKLQFNNAETVASVNELKAQLSANSGVFDLAKTISAYKDTNLAKYCVLNGSALYDEVAKTYNHIFNIYDELYGTFGTNTSLETPAVVDLLLTSMQEWLAAMDVVLADDWTASKTSFLKSEMTDLDWAKLDTLVAAIETVTDVSAIEIKNPLVADETTIQFNMQMYNVSVEVQLMVAGSKMDTPVLATKKNSMITLAAETSAADVEAAVLASGAAAAAVAEWTEKGLFVDGQYEAKASALADKLTEDITYVITYSPKYYTIDYVYGAPSDSAPYGYKLVLPEHETASKVYDYKVNGENYYQGEVVTIKGATTIDRTEGKAYDILASTNKVVSDVYFGTSDKADAILNSGALTVGNQMLAIRTPEDSCLSIDVYQLSATKYNSGYKGLEWIPTGYTLVGGTNDGDTGVFTDGKASLAGKNYDQVVVSYELTLTDDVTDLVKLPAVLNEEAEGQLSALNKLAGLSSLLSSLNKTMIGMLGNMIETADIDDGIKAEFTDVTNGILENCMDTNGSLKLYNLIDGYNQGGLVYYYSNSSAFIKELDILSGYLHELVETDEKIEALQLLIAQAGDMAAGYEDKIVEAETKLANIKADLKAPNAAIDLTSKNLSALVQALTSAGSVAPDASVTAFALTKDLSVTAPNRGSIVVTLTGGGKIESVTSTAYPLDYVLSADDVAALKNAVTLKLQTMKLSDDFYSTTYSADALDAYIGYKITAGSTKVAYEWTVKTFTVVVPGMDDQTISINDLTITLQESPDYGIIYKYTVGDKKDLVTAYTFTKEEVINLFTDGSYTVGRTVIDVKEQNLISFVNKLNDSIDNGAVQFVLVKNGDAYSVVMKINGSQPNALVNATQGMAMGFVQSGYSYIGLDGNGVLEDGKISLQAVVDTILYSGFTTDDLIKAINADGSANHMTLKGDALAGNKSQLGGELIASTMNVGDSLASSLEMDFYITLDTATGMLVKVRNLFADQLNGYLKMLCADGKATMQLTLPEKAYEAYLAALLLTDNLDIRNINAVNAEIAMGYVKNFVNPMFTGDVTLATVTNTLKEFGYNIDLSDYENIFSKVCNQCKITEFVYGDKDATVSRTFAVKPIFDAVNIPSALASVIKEYESGLTVTGAATLENLDKHYEALYVDVKADGVTNKIGLTSNLSAKLPTLTGASVVVLLDDVTGNLVFSKTTVLNLNGFTVNGNITGNGNMVIVDSALTADCGEVTGTISGNVKVLGGKYATDVTAFLKEGYTQVDGKVGNEFYTFVKDDNGDITIEINAGIVKTNEIPAVKFMLLDLAVDLLFNGYTTNMLKISGYTVFDIAMDDFVGLYAGEDRLNTLVHNIVDMVNSEDLAAIANQLIADVTDFEALQNAVLNDEALVGYTLTTGTWNLELQHITEGDYLSIGVTSGNVKDRNLYVKLVGSDADKQHIADVLGALKDTTDVEIKIEANHGFATSDDKNLVLNLGASAIINVNFSNNYDYAVMFSILLADGLAGSEASENLANGIRTYYETGDISALRVAFDAVTTSQAITAAKNFARNDSITAMVENLGIADVVADSVIELEKLFDRYGKVAAMALRQIDRLQGGDRKLGSFYKESLGGYGFTRTNLDKTFAKELVKGYSATLNVTVSEIYVCINIFGGGDAPVIEDVVADTTNDKIAGVKFDGEFIYLDAHSNGLLADELMTAMNFVVLNGKVASIEFNTTGLVATGTVVTVTAVNPATGATATLELTIIVLGDVDCDGRATVKDANLMADYFVYGVELDQYQTLALDADWSGSFNVKDALVLGDKFVYWDSYTSGLDA